LVKECIGRGGSADVYKCLFLEKNIEMALKVFHIHDDAKSIIIRDESVGFDKELESDYTLNYKDRFIIKIEGVTLKCVVMDLLNTSLDKFLLSKSMSKELMSEDVFFFF
jgi:tRNA uridine 5-carbamoylmethylation protein Kti12